MGATRMTGMTVLRAHKILGEMIAAGHGRKRLCVAKDTFLDNRESDGVTILPVHSVETACIEMADDDGGLATRKDGTACTSTVVLIGGCASDPT